eukprot:1043113-Rhodomonas_salina.1
MVIWQRGGPGGGCLGWGVRCRGSALPWPASMWKPPEPDTRQVIKGSDKRQEIVGSDSATMRDRGLRVNTR